MNSLTQNYRAVVPGSNFVQFLLVDESGSAVTPVSYYVLGGGAGGSINETLGTYTAPPAMTAFPTSGLYDTIRADYHSIVTVTVATVGGNPLLRRITFSPIPFTGTWALSHNFSDTTTPLAFNINAADLQDAIQALPGLSSVLVTGSVAAGFNLNFPDSSALIVTSNFLTGFKSVSTQILIANPLFLVCDILQNQLGLDASHIYLWDQKLFQPTDSGLYVAVSVISCKPFSNNNYQTETGTTQQDVNMYAQLGFDIISRGPAARDQKELVILALNSIYSQQQQEANQFYLGKISTGFTNLSNIDGAAIPYRFHISCAMQYVVSLNPTIQYYDQFTQLYDLSSNVTVDP